MEDRSLVDKIYTSSQNGSSRGKEREVGLGWDGGGTWARRGWVGAGTCITSINNDGWDI